MENIQIHETHIHAFSTSIHKKCNILRSQILTIKLLKFGICTKKAFFAISHKKNCIKLYHSRKLKLFRIRKDGNEMYKQNFFLTLVTLYFEPTL